MNGGGCLMNEGGGSLGARYQARGWRGVKGHGLSLSLFLSLSLSLSSLQGLLQGYIFFSKAQPQEAHGSVGQRGIQREGGGKGGSKRWHSLKRPTEVSPNKPTAK